MVSSSGRLLVRGGGPVGGEMQVPGDKSITHRAILLGSLASGDVKIIHPAPGDDCARSLAAVRAMGIAVEILDDGWILRGQGLRSLHEPDDVLDLGNSGTSARLLMGLLAGQPFLTMLTGDCSLRSRPMSRVTVPLLSMGARIWARNDGSHLPAAIIGGDISGIKYRLPVPSAQVKSALLLAGLYADSPVEITEPLPSRDHTEKMLVAMGAPLTKEKNVIRLEPCEELEHGRFTIPGDFSSAAFLMVLAALLDGSRLILKDIGLNPTRTGLLSVLQRMGVRITVTPGKSDGWEERGDLEVTAGPLKGTIVESGEVPLLIDEVPILAVAAAFAEGETVIRGAGELRVKETDRLAAVTTELARFGVEIKSFEDELLIMGRGSYSGCRCQTYGDHRMGMSLAVMGLLSEGETVIEGVSCIDTSFPGFARTLDTVLTGGSAVKEAS